jgi:hypothetical protein
MIPADDSLDEYGYCDRKDREADSQLIEKSHSCEQVSC